MSVQSTVEPTGQLANGDVLNKVLCRQSMA